MSLELIQTPAEVSLAGNCINFCFNASGAVGSIGQLAKFSIFINGRPSAGDTLQLDFVVDGQPQSINFTFASPPDTTGTQLPVDAALLPADYANLLADYLAGNNLLDQHFTVEVNETPGGFTVNICSYLPGDYQAAATGSVPFDIVTTAGHPASIDQTYKIIFEIWMESKYMAGDFSRIIRERLPVVVQQSGLSYASEVCTDIACIIIDCLKENGPEPPTFNQTEINLLCSHYRRYFIRYAEIKNGQLQLLQKSPHFYALAGGLSYEQSGQDYFAPSADFQPFLTNQCGPVSVTCVQQQFLRFFIASEQINEVKILADIVTNSGASSTINIDSTAVNVYDIITLPAGPAQLDLPPGTCRYCIYLTDQTGAQLSEKMCYQIDAMHTEKTRYLLYSNSLCGIDTLRLDGATITNIESTVKTAARPADCTAYQISGQVVTYGQQTQTSYTTAGRPRLFCDMAALEEILLSCWVAMVKYCQECDTCDCLKPSAGYYLPVTMDASSLVFSNAGNGKNDFSLNYQQAFSDSYYSKNNCPCPDLPGFVFEVEETPAPNCCPAAGNENIRIYVRRRGARWFVYIFINFVYNTFSGTVTGSQIQAVPDAGAFSVIVGGSNPTAGTVLYGWLPVNGSNLVTITALLTGTANCADQPHEISYTLPPFVLQMPTGNQGWIFTDQPMVCQDLNQSDLPGYCITWQPADTLAGGSAVDNAEMQYCIDDGPWKTFTDNPLCFDAGQLTGPLKIRRIIRTCICPDPLTITQQILQPPVDNAPEGTSQNLVVCEGETLIFDIDAYDPEGGPVSINNFTLGISGNVTASGPNTFTYTPNSGFLGTDFFTYTVIDSGGNVSRNITASIQVIECADGCDAFSFVIGTYIDTIKIGLQGVATQDVVVTAAATNAATTITNIYIETNAIGQQTWAIDFDLTGDDTVSFDVTVCLVSDPSCCNTKSFCRPDGYYLVYEMQCDDAGQTWVTMSIIDAGNNGPFILEFWTNSQTSVNFWQMPSTQMYVLDSAATVGQSWTVPVPAGTVAFSGVLYDSNGCSLPPLTSNGVQLPLTDEQCSCECSHNELAVYRHLQQASGPPIDYVGTIAVNLTSPPIANIHLICFMNTPIDFRQELLEFIENCTQWLVLPEAGYSGIETHIWSPAISNLRILNNANLNATLMTADTVSFDYDLSLLPTEDCDLAFMQSNLEQLFTQLSNTQGQSSRITSSFFRCLEITCI